MSVTNLTGYTWVGNANYVCSQSYLDLAINGKIDGTDFTYLYIGYKMTAFENVPTANTICHNSSRNNSYTGNNTIVFSGGSGVTNATLIAWLEANGTLTAPSSETKNIHLGNTPISKILLGETEVSKVYKGETPIWEKGSGPTGETWLINETPTLTRLGVSISFTSNHENYNTFNVDLIGIEYSGRTVYGDDREGFAWTNQAYRTVVFEEPPTGTLLTWLQANAVKQ